MEEFEQSNSDASQEASSEPQSQAVEQEQASQEAKPNNEDNLPFHQHPRWIEREEQWKSRFSQQEESYRAALSRLEALEKGSKNSAEAEDALIARLKGIDPEFGQRIEKMWSAQSRLEQLEQKIQSYEAKESRSQVMNTMSQLHSEYKVSKELQPWYQSRIQALATSDPSLGPQDLPRVYKQVHDELSKFLDTQKRADRESYVADKKKEASTPASTTKGKPAVPSNKKEIPADPEAARQQMIQEILKEARAGRNV